MINQHLKAGALIYALFIMVISVIMVGVVMGTAYFYHNRQVDYINQQKMLSFTQSALLTALNDSTITFPWQIDLPETDSSKTFTGSIERYGYGAFQRFIIQSVLGKYHQKEAVLAGTSGILPVQTAVFIPADSYELCLSGTNMLKGDCYLGKAGARASYVMGDYYRNKELVQGTIKKSEGEWPGPDINRVSELQQYLSGSKTLSDSLLDITKAGATVFSNSFFNKTLVLYSQGPIYLTGGSFTGNIAIMSSDSICVYQGCSLNQVILLAPKIKLTKGIIATCQLIASDTILIEDEVQLTYPSVVMTLPEKNTGLIRMGEKVLVEGNVIMTENREEKTSKNICFIPEKTTIRGIVHIEGKLNFRGNVQGTVATKLFTLQTASGYYENYLYNSVIDATALDKNYVSADVYGLRRYKIITEVD